MKKGKVFGKTQIALAVMVVALGAAIWLNMEYAGADTAATDGNSSKYLGEAEYVNATVSTEDETSKTEEYFLSLKKDRQTARDEAVGIIEESLSNQALTADDKENLLLKSEELATRSEKEAAIETILKAKGFTNVIAVIGDDDINIVTQSDGLKEEETVQIRDAVMSQTDFSVNEIKIVTMSAADIENALK